MRIFCQHAKMHLVHEGMSSQLLVAKRAAKVTYG
jgi:hypothetical protein